MRNYVLGVLFYVFCGSTYSQTENELVKNTIMNYINGTSYNKTELIKEAFYEDANLYLTNKDNELWVLPSKEYISMFEKNKRGKFSGRVGRIISIDRENDIALAKAEIFFLGSNLRFVDIFIMKKINGSWKIMSKSATKENANKQGKNILFIVSNAHYYGSSQLRTGNSFVEMVNAYHTLDSAGFSIDFMSPKGGAIPVAYVNTSDSLQKKYFYNPDFIAALKDTKSPDLIEPSNYQAVYYVGGGSAMFGVPENENIHRIVMGIYEENDGIIASVCHGTAGIINLKTKDGKYLVKGKKVSGYPESYEQQDAEYFKQFPFFIQKTIEKRGGVFNVSPKNYAHLEVDGHLVTGQNHLSSSLVALKIIELLRDK